LVTCLNGGLSVTITVISGVINYLIFFGTDLYVWAKRSARRISSPRSIPSLHRVTRTTHHHQCVTCGANDSDNPDLEFRYCSKCTGNPCFCSQHLNEHKANQHTVH
jgi:hypothetical protein